MSEDKPESKKTTTVTDANVGVISEKVIIKGDVNVIGNQPDPSKGKAEKTAAETSPSETTEPKPPFLKRILPGIILLFLLIPGVLIFLHTFHFHPKIVDEHLRSADRFLNSGMYPEALEQYEEALKHCQKCPEASTGKAKAEAFREVAETDYNPGEMIRKLKNNPKFPKDDLHIRLLTANVHLQNGDRKKAEKIYRALTEEKPEFAEAWFSLGVLYHQQGKTRNARNMFEKAVSLSENFKYQGNLAWTNLETGQYADAIETYEKMLQADKNSLVTHAEIAKALWLDKKPDEALLYQKSLAEKLKDPKIAEKQINRSAWYFPMEDETVILDSIESKRYYAEYSVAATLYLLGLKYEAEKAVKNAESVQIKYVDAINIRALIDHDISEILEKYPEDGDIRQRAAEFRIKKRSPVQMK